MSKRKIDHIVYAVPNLEWGIDHIHNLVGVRPTFGGYHTTQGTKNAILNLGNQIYLEILAVDMDNTAFSNNRWMGIDLIQNPKITRWAIKSSDLLSDVAVLSKNNPSLGHKSKGERKMTNGELLQWEMALPLSTPEVELMPFMIDWKDSAAHPTDGLSDACRLNRISFYHPEPARTQSSFNELGIHEQINLDHQPKISISIQCPNGVVQLG